MPKINPETGEPMTDDPSVASAEEQGGKRERDGNLPEGSNPTGSDAPTQKG